MEERGTETHELDNIMNSINKDMYEVAFCLSVESQEEDGEGITVQLGGKKYSIVEGENIKMELSIEKPKSSKNLGIRRTPVVVNQLQKNFLNKKTGKTAVMAESNDLNCMLFVDKDEIKTENTQFGNKPDDHEVCQEIYEFDELEELSGDPSVENGTQGITLLKMVPAKSDGLHAGPLSHACPHCDYKAPKRYMLSRHMKSHSDERPYVCSVCDRGFKTNHTLQNHMNVHLGKKPHACLSCDSRFTTPGDLSRHVRYKHTHDKRHKCTECDYATVELSKLRRHMRAHTGERPYQCPHCTYASPDTFKLKRHLRTHTGEKPYECDICQSRFTQSNSLKSHKLIHSVDDKPVFQCALCPTTCSRKSDLRIHVQKLHYSETPFPCKRCGKELPDRYSYKMHIKTHDGERCYGCDQCHYKSISMRNLEIHKQIHSDEKPFRCEICGQTFRQKQLLGRHTNLYHTENYVPPPKLEKIHDCPYCKRSFAHKGNMVRHMQLHDTSEVEKSQQIHVDIEKSKHSNENDLDYQYLSGDETTMNQENFEEYEVIDEVETDEIGDYVIIETVLPTTSNQKIIKQVRKVEPLTEPEESDSEYQNINSLKEIEKQSITAKTKNEFDEQVLGEDSELPGFMVVKVLQSDDEMDEDDDDNNCVILANLDEMKSTESAKSNNNKVKVDVDNCFGFKIEDDKASGNIEEAVLLNIIEEN